MVSQNNDLVFQNDDFWMIHRPSFLFNSSGMFFIHSFEDCWWFVKLVLGFVIKRRRRKKYDQPPVVSTGVFVAPVAGVYYFSIFYHAGGRYHASLELYKNNQVTVMASHNPAQSAINGGNAVFLQLQRGDQVFVRLARNTYVWGSLYHTTFSGFLVTQMWHSAHCISTHSC